MGTDKITHLIFFFIRSDEELAYSTDTVLDVFPNLILKEIDIIMSKISFVQTVSVGLCKTYF